MVYLCLFCFLLPKRGYKRVRGRCKRWNGSRFSPSDTSPSAFGGAACWVTGRRCSRGACCLHCDVLGFSVTANTLCTGRRTPGQGPPSLHLSVPSALALLFVPHTLYSSAVPPARARGAVGSSRCSCNPALAQASTSSAGSVFKIPPCRLFPFLQPAALSCA